MRPEKNLANVGEVVQLGCFWIGLKDEVFCGVAWHPEVVLSNGGGSPGNALNASIDSIAIAW